MQQKAGNYEILESGQVKILTFTLEPNEIDFIYKGKEGQDVETENGVLVSLDTNLSQELIKEGYMREIIRYIQDMRKEAGYQVSDRILCLVESEPAINEAVLLHSDTIKTETLSNELQVGGDLEWDLEKNVEIEGYLTKLAVKLYKS